MSEKLVSPAILSGFMELLPQEQIVFDRMKETIENGFRRYGFWPLDTPAIEKSEVLFSKGGGETTKQIYRIDKGASSTEQALRFDLTVPMARYVALHESELPFPFRRYQIAKVYRGERSQKGRYREFYQCDIDIVGREQLAVENDAEMPSVIYHIFQELGIGAVSFHINNRRLLNGFFATLGISDSEGVLRAVDKLTKIGEEAVSGLLREEGLSEETVGALFDFLKPLESNAATLTMLDRVGAALDERATSPGTAAAYREGLNELRLVYERMQAFGVPEERICIDLSITRGLDYYTGTVFETFLCGYELIGSICSGGRYDNLASNFTKTHLPGVGLSIGLTRLYYQLQQAGLISSEKGEYIRALVLPMSGEDLAYAIETANFLRAAGVCTQIYLEGGKAKKKLAYADRVGARYAVLIGEQERAEQRVALKDLTNAAQWSVTREELLERLCGGR